MSEFVTELNLRIVKSKDKRTVWKCILEAKIAQIFALVPIIAVMFTFSFSSAFAASYDIDDVASALEAEKTLQLSYLENAKTQAVNSYELDDDGFIKTFLTITPAVKYNKAAVEAAADKVIADVEATMNKNINNALNGTFPVSTIDKTPVTSAVPSALLTKDGMKTALEKETATLNETQAPLTKAFVEGKLAVDLSKYDNTEKLYEKDSLTAVQYIEKLTAEAKKAIADADDFAAAKKIAAYEKALNTFETKMKGVKTLEDQAIEDGENAKGVDFVISVWVFGAQSHLYPVVPVTGTSVPEFPVDFTTGVTAKFAAFYEAKTSTAKATLFGVEIDDITKVTRTEAAAVNNALYAAINDAAKVIKVYAGNDVDKVGELIVEEYYLRTIRNSMDVADKYAEVKELGEKLKKEYSYGIKRYDDAKVDAAVADAEALVYGDLNKKKLETAEYYLEKATENNDLDDLLAVNYEYQRFEKAVEDAKAKFIDRIEVYGDNKTAEADKVYAKELYAVADDYDKIKKDTCEALEVAQSYAEISEIMAGAAEELGKLMLAADAKEVEKAQEAYKTSLENYSLLRQSLVDTTKYTKTAFTDAVKAGEKLIDEAVTVDGVKAAYAEAQAIIDGLKTKAELEDMAKAVVAQIDALPYTAKLTAADAATVQAAYEAYVEYVKTPGADKKLITNSSLLSAKLKAVIEAEAKEINDAAADLAKAYKKLGNSDADNQAKLAMKADIQALADKAAALTDKVDGINDDAVFGKVSAGLSADVTYLQDLVDVEGAYYYLAVDMAEQALYLAAKQDATVEEMKAALEAYNNLTDKQKYWIDWDAIEWARIIESKLATVVESLKITASSKATKGAITVTWKVAGDAAAADGYQIWKSTKKNSGFKKAFTTTKTSYKNTKGLEKGTRYYYKVRAYIVVDGKNVYSDWSNKAYRVAQ